VSRELIACSTLLLATKLVADHKRARLVQLLALVALELHKVRIRQRVVLPALHVEELLLARDVGGVRGWCGWECG